MAVEDRITQIPLPYPKNERQWQEFLLNLGDVIQEIVTDTIDQSRLGSITNQAILPMEVTGNRGAIQNTLPLSATDLGSSVGTQINVAAHYCLHGGLQVDYAAGSIGSTAEPLAYSTGGGGDVVYYVYIDNPGYVNDLSDYQATTDFMETMASGRYYVGQVTAPQDGAGDTTGGGGGGGGVAPPGDPNNGGIFP